MKGNSWSRVITPHPPLVKGGLRGIIVRADYGFTLLELLISMTILGIIVLIIVGALRLGFHSVDAGEKKIESLERIRTSLTLIDSQIQSISPLTYDEEGAKKSFFRGERGSLTFSTNYSIWGGQKGYVVVTYRVVPNVNGTQTLYASENILGIENKAETKLLDAFDAIYFEYFTKEIFEEEERERWVEQWTEENVTPEKVRLHLVSKGKDLTILIPIRTGGTQTGT